jgi:hypothetical protein
MNRRLTGFVAPEGTERPSRIYLAPHLADLFRRVCAHLKRPHGDAFEEMLELLIKKSNLEPIYGKEKP